MRKFVSLVLPAAAILFGAVAVTSVSAQDNPRGPHQIQRTPADDAAAAAAAVVYTHAHPAKNAAGAALRARQAVSARQRAAASARSFSQAEGSSTEGSDQLRFPADLTDFFGGPTVAFAQSHPIFLLPSTTPSCKANSCWGDPATFLALYGESGLSHVTDQYVGTSARDRYTLGDGFVLSYTPPATPLIDGNIRAVVHAAASISGETGYDHIYHVFLPPGQDECFDATFSTCYAPDNPNGFAFCAYHGSVTFSDIGHVLYTVEPFQNVQGCKVRAGTPNGQLIDSTNNTLSHETTETITDPDGDAWFNITDVGLEGEEIGDECQFFVLVQVSPTELAAFGDPSIFRVGKAVFATQPEYSNQDHACAVRP